MTTIWKRSISMLLALVMVFGMVPMNVWAAETETPDAEITEIVETDAAPETAEAAEEAQETEAAATEAEEPEPETLVTEPEVTEAEIAETEVTESETTEPEVTEPAITEPETTESEPETTESEVTEPEITEPEETEVESTESEETVPEETESEMIEVTEDALEAAITSLAMFVDGKEVAELEMDKSSEEDRSIVIMLKAWDAENAVQLKASDVKWTSSDTKLATVAVQEDGSAKVTVKKGQYGVANITATAKGKDGASASFVLTVKDYSPRLGENKVTLDAMGGERTFVSLATSYDNTITAIRFANDTLNKLLDVSHDPSLESAVIAFKDDLKEMPKNGTYKTELIVETDHSPAPYKYPFTVVIKNTLPAVTIKQNGKFLWNVSDSWVDLSLTAKTGAITTVEVDSDDFEMAYYTEDEAAFGNAENGGQYLCLQYTQDYIDRVLSEATPTKPMKPDAKVTLRLWVEGYAFPISKDITVKLTDDKVKLVANPTASALNTALGDQGQETKYTVSFDIREKGNDWAYDLREGEENGHAYIWFADKSVDWDYDEENFKITVSYDTAKNRTETLYVRLPHHLDYVKVTHKITVNSKLPTLKLGNATITLAKPVDFTGSTTAALDQGNVALARIDFEPTAKGEALKEAEKIQLDYAMGEISAWLDEGLKASELPKSGTYTYNATPYVFMNGELVPLKAVKVKVKVADVKPAYKLSATNIKLNTELDEVVTIRMDGTNKDADNVWLVGFTGTDKYKNDVELKYNEIYGEFTAKLLSNKTGKYTYELNPVVQSFDGGTAALTNVKVKLTIQAYKGEISIKQSAKGKLDALNLESEILYTVSKINNSTGVLETVELIGDNAALFELTGLREDAKGKQIYGLKLKSGVTYSTKQSYKVKFRYKLDDGNIFASEVTVKVTEGKLKAAAAKVTYHLSQNNLLLRLNLTAPENAKLDTIKLNADKTSKELLAAMGENGSVKLMGQGGMTAWIHVKIQDHSGLKVGKTYKLVLDVTPEGMTAESKPVQVTISIKIAK